MDINDMKIGEAKELANLFCSSPITQGPTFNGPVVAQFIGRFVFVCNLRIEGGWCYLTDVRNIRYWDTRDNGLGDLAKQGPQSGDRIDNWPDQVIPLDKLGPVMQANSEKWS